MKLYYSPAACSLASHISLREAGMAFETEKVDLRSKKTDAGNDFYAINPKGYVPTLTLDDGQILTENVAVLSYIADHAPAGALQPAAGTADHYRFLEWLGYITTELHKGMGALFFVKDDAARGPIVDRLGKRLQFANDALAGREFVVGTRFTAADAYLFAILNWAPIVKVDLSQWPNLAAFHARVAQRPAVLAALKAEGLI